MKAIFLDDERFPKTHHYDWVILRSVEDAQKYVLENGCPSYISFDNDLQRELEGWNFAQWLIDQDLNQNGNFLPENFAFNVHSANVAASDLIFSKLDSYLRYKRAKYVTY